MLPIRAHFDSLDAFCTAPCVNPENEQVIRDKIRNERGEWKVLAGKHWLGTETTQEAADRVTKGWPEGAARIFECMSNMEVTAPVSVKRKIARGAQGDELDIHCVYRGDLEHAWTSRRRKHTRSQRTVRIVAQTNLLSNVSAEEMFWRGAAIVKLSDALTEAGYGVEIIAALASKRIQGHNVEFLATFPMKHAHDPLDCEMLAGVLAHAGFHRIYGFRMYAALFPVKAHAAAGGNASTSTDGRVIRNGNLDADGVFTLVAPYHITTQERAQKWVNSVINQLGDQS